MLSFINELNYLLYTYKDTHCKSYTYIQMVKDTDKHSFLKNFLHLLKLMIKSNWKSQDFASITG